MCTVITLQRPGHTWPLLLAANRDERLDRPWDPPAEYWPDRPGVIAGRDRLAGGTWMGMNEAGLVAAVLNRTGSLGPAPGKFSRGMLPLLALEHSSAAEAADAILASSGPDYRSFNLVLADRSSVWFVRNDETGRLSATALPPGLHMVTAHDPDDETSPRVARHLTRFRSADAPEPPVWRDWPHLLADSAGPRIAALTVPPENGFGTVCASLLGIPAQGAASWLFAPGPASRAAFSNVKQPAGGEPGMRLL